MKKLAILLIILFASTIQQSYAQTIDSLKTVLQTAKHDTTKMRIMNDLFWIEVKDNPANSIKTAKELLDIAEKNNSKKYLGLANKCLGAYFDEVGDFVRAVEYYTAAIDLFTQAKDLKGLSSTLNNKGVAFARMGDFTKATDVILKSLQIADSTNNKKQSATSRNNLAGVYFYTGNFDKAATLLRNAIITAEKNNDKIELANSLEGYGLVLMYSEQLDSAEYYYQKALKLYQDANYELGYANCLNNLATLYENKGDLQKSLLYLNNSIESNQKIGNNAMLSSALNNLAGIYQKLGNMPKAIECQKRALKLAEETKNKLDQKIALEGLSYKYENLKDFQTALQFFRKSIVIKDSIFNDSKSKELGKLEAKYDFQEQTILKDKENEKVLAIEKEKRQKQFIIILFTIVCFILAVIFTVLIYRRLQITKQQKLVIEEQKEEVEAQRDQIETQKHIIEEKHTEIQESINYAKRIQNAILPPNSLIQESLEKFFILYKPKDVVAGDFYWFEKIGDNIFIAAADCTGHGVPGAMVSVVCHGALTRCVREYNLAKPSEILNKTRELVIETFQKSEEKVKDGMDISLLKINFKTNQFEWAGANNPLYIFRNENKEIEIVKADKQPIGLSENFSNFTNHEITVLANDEIFLFTDGYADQFGGKDGKKMGYKAFRDYLSKISDEEINNQKSMLELNFSNWKINEEQIDDVCIIGVKV